MARIWLADANFGIFERDVAIAEKVAELKNTYGYPKVFATNYAKNTVKHLKPIVKVMADAGIIAVRARAAFCAAAHRAHRDNSRRASFAA